MNDATNTTRHYPVIRVFVSSTFSDLKHERNELQRLVFRELEAHCLRRHFQFQAIDLRWGVPSEASLDHCTMRICFEELRRSQQVSPRPNFLILLGDRYGWRPLPEEISLAEYERLADAGAAESYQFTVLEQWYRRDDNAVPPVHVLRSRRDSPDGRDYGRDKVTRQDSAAWKEVQAALWAVINRAFPPEQLASRFAPSNLEVSAVPSFVRFQTSATEQEIWHGALQVPEAAQHVFSFVRKLSNVEQCLADARPEEKLGDFIDLKPDQSRDNVAWQAQSQLLEALEKRLGSKGYHKITADAQLHRDPATGCFDVSTTHLQSLCDSVHDKLLGVIDRQMDEYWRPAGLANSARTVDDAGSCGVLPSHKLRELELEIEAHARFGAERAPTETFVGREQETQRILQYMRGDDSRPLVVYGPSGTGKTALLAHAVRQAQDQLAGNPIIRYLGTTAHSASIRSLLTSLRQQLLQAFGVAAEPPAELRELEDEFYKLLADHAAQPIYLFLDALDQLDDTDDGRRLSWLRTSAQQPLPSHVRLVVSCLSDVPDDDPAGLPLRTLFARGLTTSGVSLNTLTEAEAKTLLFDRWLGPDAASTRGELRPHRTIAPESKSSQRAYLERCLTQSPDASDSLSPLYLKLLYEEARLWRSFDAPPDRLPATVSDLLRTLFRRLRQSDQHGTLVDHVLGYLSAARYGLAETELLEILFADPEYKKVLDRTNARLGHEFPSGATRIPIVLWSRLRYELQPYLAERNVPGTAVLKFYHRQVAEAAILDTPSRRKWHLRLADYFETVPFGGRRAYELPWHLLRCRQFARLRACVVDPQLVEYLSREGAEYELMGYWSHLAVDQRLGWALESALRTSSCTEEERANRSQIVGRLLCRMGHHKLATTALERALNILESLGREKSLIYAQAQYWLADAEHEIGNEPRAWWLAWQAKNLCEEICGPKHPSTLECRQLIARYRSEGGDDVRNDLVAESECRELLADCETTFGRMDGKTAMAMNDLGLCKLQLEEYQEAESLLRESRDIMESIRGPHHRDLTPVLHNLAESLSRQGGRSRLAEAIRYYRREIEILDSTVGPHHPETCIAVEDLASLLVHVGETKEAGRLRRRLLGSLARRSLGLHFVFWSVLGVASLSLLWLVRTYVVRSGD